MEQLIKITGTIGKDCIGKDVVNLIEAYDADNSISLIKMVINSEGGSVMDGIAIFNAMQNCKTKISVDIIYALSIASIIASGGDYISQYQYGMYMMHDPSLGCSADELTLSERKMLAKVKSSLVTIYANRTKLDEGTIIDLMEKEEWFLSDEAQAAGIIDNIIKVNKREFTNGIEMVMNKLKNYKENMKNELDEKEVKAELDEPKKDEEVKAELDEPKKDDEDVVNEDENKDAVIEELQKHIVELEKQLAEYTSKEEVALENKVANILAAHKSKLSDKEYSKWMSIGKEDIAFVQSNFGKVLVNKTTKKIENVKKDEDNGLVDLHKLSKKDPKAVHNMMINQPARYAENYKYTYGVAIK